MTKWENELDPFAPEASSTILHTFIAQRIAWYIENNFIAGLLWDSYREDFENWNAEMMKKCNPDVIKLLRNFLVMNGVYIARDSRKNVIKLIDILEEKEDHEWTKEEIILQESRGGGFSKRFKPPQNFPMSSPSYPNFSLTQATGSAVKREADQYNSYSANTAGYNKISRNNEKSSNQVKDDGQSRPDYVASDYKPLPPYGFSKQLTDLAKLYFDNESKYSGELYDILDSKIAIFFDYCGKVGLHKEQYHNAFSSMLRDRARQFYYDQLANKGYNFDQMIALTKAHFETEENKQEYPEKKISECFSMMVDKLQKIQHGLWGSYHVCHGRQGLRVRCPILGTRVHDTTTVTRLTRVV
ncbi:hypothetical protein K3495_g14135, partial [Podosphaera aphanis]